jgi:diacylglycerol kinase (ATP)
MHNPLPHSADKRACPVLLYHPKAGKGRALWLFQEIREKLREKSLPFDDRGADWPSDLLGYRAAWIIGGDGTLNHFINCYPDAGIPIALFKGGSGNDFAWKLYGERTMAEYLDLAIAGRDHPVDAGICNGRYFLNGVGIGFDGEVVRAMGGKKILSAGHISYLLTVLRKIFTYRETSMRIITGGNEKSGRFFMVSVANGSRYGGGFLVAPQASLTDGALDLVIIRQIGPLSRLRYLPEVQKGRHLGRDFADYSLVKHIVVESEQSLPAHLDGEWMEARRLEIEILPGKFRFIC